MIAVSAILLVQFKTRQIDGSREDPALVTVEVSEKRHEVNYTIRNFQVKRCYRGLRKEVDKIMNERRHVLDLT